MAEVYESNVINQEKPTKMLLEVARSKQIFHLIQIALHHEETALHKLW